MLSQFYAPIIGGEERIVQDLSIALSERGHEVAVATLQHPGQAAHDLDRGVAIHRLRSTAQRASWIFAEPGRHHAPPWPDPETTLGLKRVAAGLRPDIVHAHNWIANSFLPLKKASRARFVLTLHDFSLVCANKRLMRHGRNCSGPQWAKCMACSARHYGPLKGVPTAAGHWAMRGAMRAAVDMFLPVSQAVAKGSGLVDSQLPYQVVPNFLPDAPPSADAADPRLLAQLPADGFAMFAGDLTHDKGINVLLKAYATLSHAPPLVVIGRQPAGPPLVAPPNVFIFNSWPHASVLAAWRRCGVALAPSIWREPFGLVVLEAMAAGRPVIGSRTGGIADIVLDGETGFLVPPNDAPALAAAMAAVFETRELQEKMGQAGRQRARDFTATAIVPRVEAIYRALADAGAERVGAGRAKRTVSPDDVFGEAVDG